MSWLKRLRTAINQEPGLWMQSSFLTGLSLGFVLWSWKIGLASICALWLFLFLRRLRPFFLLAWTSCWAVVWYEFVIWLLPALHKHPYFLDRLPTYFAAALCVFLWIMWMGVALVLGDVYFEQKAARDAECERYREDDASAKESAPFNPYAVLDVSPGATNLEIKDGYHRQMTLYHPDKVQHLGEDLKATAERKTLEIQHAFEILNGREGSKRPDPRSPARS